MIPNSKVNLIVLVVAGMLAAVGPASAAPPSQAEARAIEARSRAHITAFPGFTLHGPGHNYVLKDIVVDDDGSHHARFDREYRGMRVVGGDLVVHSDRGGNFRNASQTLARLINVADRAGVSAAEAVQAALAAHPGDSGGKRPELVVYAREAAALAYEVIVDGELDDQSPSELHVIIDAASAKILPLPPCLFFMSTVYWLPRLGSRRL